MLKQEETRPKGTTKTQKVAKSPFKKGRRTLLSNLWFISLLFLLQEAVAKIMQKTAQNQTGRKIMATTATANCSNIPSKDQVIYIGLLLPYYELDFDDFIGIHLLQHFTLNDSSYAHCLRIRLSDTYNGSFLIRRSHDPTSNQKSKKNVIHLLINATTLYNYIYTKVHGHPPSSSKEFLKSPTNLKSYLPHKKRLFFDLEVKLSLNQSFSEIPDSEMDHPEDSKMRITSQHLKGEVLDLTFDFRRATNITKIKFMRNSIPMLPFSNKNIFMASMTFTPKRVQMNRTVENNANNPITSETWNYPNNSQPSKEFLRSLPFTFNMTKRDKKSLLGLNSLKSCHPTGKSIWASTSCSSPRTTPRTTPHQIQTVET